jgi:hypothetical protein
MDNRTYKKKLTQEEYVAECEASLKDPFQNELHIFGNDLLQEEVKHLEELIKGQRILVIGSGETANELESIPSDVKVFTCNTSYSVLLRKNIERKIDLHLTSRESIKIYSNKANNMLVNNNQIEDLKKIGVNNIICNSADELIEGTYQMYDLIKNNYYAIQLIKPKPIKEISENWLLHCREASSGLRLVIYALYYGAKEVYTIGLDNSGGYSWDSSLQNYPHVTFDIPYLKELVKTHKNIYSVSKNSKITEIIEHKELL